MEPSSKQPVSGLLNLNKPSGVSSRKALDGVARLLPRLKVGHAGTLDPLASGVLVVCIGTATRLVEFIQQMPKTYQATVLLGARSDTLDAAGQVTPVPNAPVPEFDQLRKALEMVASQAEQTPPQFSALKVGGRRAYDLARAGRHAALSARKVTIHRIDLLSYEWPRLELEIDCGSGTYIRSIARDLGEALGCGGIVETLVRTRIGHFTLASAVALADLSAETLKTHLRAPLEALGNLPRVVLSAAELAAVGHGQALVAESADRRTVPAGRVALLGPDAELAAIAQHDPLAQRLLPRLVFTQS
ncbi:MAG TPA: tRNA pseudouridine(55) synthase TruB [Isosphaeraceae bacterium]|jgi:tRNA pseudouridine55 synthase|nr:tRNA pseudouridine(55) synthase TruB [Isosphaeraceae bacterium]